MSKVELKIDFKSINFKTQKALDYFHEIIRTYKEIWIESGSVREAVYVESVNLGHNPNTFDLSAEVGFVCVSCPYDLIKEILVTDTFAIRIGRGTESCVFDADEGVTSAIVLSATTEAEYTLTIDKATVTHNSSIPAYLSQVFDPANLVPNYNPAVYNPHGKGYVPFQKHEHKKNTNNQCDHVPVNIGVMCPKWICKTCDCDLTEDEVLTRLSKDGKVR